MLREDAARVSGKSAESSAPAAAAAAAARLPAVEELTLGLKQKLQLRARARAAPYCLRCKPEPADLVDRLLEERALVAEAVRRLQALRQQVAADESRRGCAVDS